MVTVYAQQTMNTTLTISQNCLKKKQHNISVQKHVTLMQPVLPLTFQMDSVMHTKQILLLAMLEVDIVDTHAITRLSFQKIVILQ